MPGFLMHLAEGKIILEQLGKCNNPDSPDYIFCQQFLLGTILPDVTNNKELTHFRPSWQKHMIAKYPDMECFLHLHKKDILSPADMGILAHLHMDTIFVTDFWPDYFHFQNEYGRKTVDTREKLYANIHKSGQLIPLKDFFSSKHFYKEYDILNPYILEKCNITLPDVKLYNKSDIHIPECIPDSIEDIEKCLDAFIPISYNDEYMNQNITTNIFKLEDILDFLNSSSDKYIKNFTYV